MDADKTDENRKRKREQEESDAALAAQIAQSEPYDIIEYDTTFAFCCYNCRCEPMKKTEKHGLTIDQEGTKFLHRLCCHNRPESDQDMVWGKYPLVHTIERSLKRLEPSSLTVPAVRVLTLQDMKKSAQQAIREEKKIQTELESADPSSIWYSNAQNTTYAFNYFRRLESKKVKTRAVVLELFAGVGSGLIALKRLQIDIEKVISVEHDEFANYVRNQNNARLNSNNSSEGALEDDNIFYEDILTFEEVENSYDALLNRHGAIDIVIAGPPCSDFSAVNAKRRGISGIQGSYLLRFGNLVEKIKRHPLQQGVTLYVICENVTISEKDGLSKVENHLKCTGHRIDAKYFSPCKRDRTYFTSFPTDQVNHTSVDAEYSAGRHFLKDGWMHVAEASGINSNQKTLKANTLMASMGRIDDGPRMWKARKKNNIHFEVQPFSVKDRERMMGFPEGYLQKPLSELFTLMTKAFLNQYWAIKMPELGKYSGLPFAYKRKLHPPFFELYAGPPLPKNQKKQNYFSASGYAKHLIGNAFSIPVMEHLMTPLKELFATREYEGYSYPYPWPPHNLGVNEEDQDNQVEE